MERKSIKKSQGGFTLIEIIAVLVILGILAAVAIPRFVALQDEARDRAALNAVSAAQSALSMAYASLLLQNDGTLPTAAEVIAEANPNCGVSDDDFTVTCTVAAAGVDISAAGPGGGVGLGSWNAELAANP